MCFCLTALFFSGVLLHYDDPLLRDLYFLDPQWLCDMLAHVVTIREVNPHMNNGTTNCCHAVILFFCGFFFSIDFHCSLSM